MIRYRGSTLKTDAEIRTFVRNVENSHFRTNEDTGANPNALFIWNLVREFFDMDRLKFEDLPAYCVTHEKYHIINKEYGCKRKPSTYHTDS